ncbi:MAG: NADH-quinone oxidoreductase subunit C [bacterium]
MSPQEVIKERFPGVCEEEDCKDLTFRIDKGILLEFMDFLYKKLSFEFLTDICGTDYPKREKRFDVVYHLYSIEHNHRICVKTSVSENEDVESVSSIWKGANWHEREVFDLFGIRFLNHPDLKRILLPDEWEGHPLRKDYPLEIANFEYEVSRSQL